MASTPDPGERTRALRASDYPPPALGELVRAPSDADPIEVGVCIVGAGPAGLACAIRLGQLLADDPATAERLGEVPVAVLEKGKQAGSHLLSGAVVNPRALERLFRGRVALEQMPLVGPVARERVYLLTRGRALPLPTPPTMRNHGNVLASLSRLGRFLAQEAEQGGAMILSETAATSLLQSEGRVVGVRSGDKGRGRGGSRSRTSSRAPICGPPSRCSARARRATSRRRPSTTSGCGARSHRPGSSA